MRRRGPANKKDGKDKMLGSWKLKKVHAAQCLNVALIVV
jgi:hypothetical protein